MISTATPKIGYVVQDLSTKLYPGGDTVEKRYLGDYIEDWIQAGESALERASAAVARGVAPQFEESAGSVIDKKIITVAVAALAVVILIKVL